MIFSSYHLVIEQDGGNIVDLISDRDSKLLSLESLESLIYLKHVYSLFLTDDFYARVYGCQWGRFGHKYQLFDLRNVLSIFIHPLSLVLCFSKRYQYVLTQHRSHIMHLQFSLLEEGLCILIVTKAPLLIVLKSIANTTFQDLTSRLIAVPSASWKKNTPYWLKNFHQWLRWSPSLM
jgi:hypothetical protein